jgi:hypothetical protein
MINNVHQGPGGWEMPMGYDGCFQMRRGFSRSVQVALALR